MQHYNPEQIESFCLIHVAFPFYIKVPFSPFQRENIAQQSPSDGIHLTLDVCQRHFGPNQRSRLKYIGNSSNGTFNTHIQVPLRMNSAHCGEPLTFPHHQVNITFFSWLNIGQSLQSYAKLG